MVFAATSNTVVRFGGFATGQISTASTDIWQPMTGATAATAPATESDMQFTFRTSGSLKNMGLNVSSNGRSTSTTFKSRIGGADGALSASIAGSGTGNVEDTTHSDSISSGNLVNWDVLTGSGAGNLIIDVFNFDFETTNGAFQSAVGSLTKTFNASTTNYISIAGNMNNSTTESDYQTNARITDTLSKLDVRVITNTVTAASTLRTRKNAANGNLSASITGSNTGVFSDGSHSDSVVDGDQLDYQIVTGASGTSIILTSVGLLRGAAAPSGTVVTRRFIGIGG